MFYEQMWFGTMHHMGWIRCPSVGPEMSSHGWGSNGTYLSGGGYGVQSADSHREYQFSWSAASTIPEVAQMMAYRDGAYSMLASDLLYFHDPLSFGLNVLPKRWAQPSLLARARKAESEAESSTALRGRGFPLTGAMVVSGTEKFPSAPERGVVFLPIPEGYQLEIATESTHKSGDGMFVRPVLADGTFSAPQAVGSTSVLIKGGRGVLLYMRGPGTYYGSRAVLTEAKAPRQLGAGWEWSPGMGHSGCRFDGEPTYVPMNGIDGGMASFAATLREVGDWQI